MHFWSHVVTRLSDMKFWRVHREIRVRREFHSVWEFSDNKMIMSFLLKIQEFYCATLFASMQNFF